MGVGVVVGGVGAGVGVGVDVVVGGVGVGVGVGVAATGGVAGVGLAAGRVAFVPHRCCIGEDRGVEALGTFTPGGGVAVTRLVDGVAGD